MRRTSCTAAPLVAKHARQPTGRPRSASVVRSAPAIGLLLRRGLESGADLELGTLRPALAVVILTLDHRPYRVNLSPVQTITHDSLNGHFSAGLPFAFGEGNRPRHDRVAELRVRTGRL